MLYERLSLSGPIPMYVYIYIYIIVFFVFNDPATTEIYTLSLHDALPIWSDRPVDGTRNSG